jgi:Toprim-like
VGDENPGAGWREAYQGLKSNADQCPIFVYDTPRPRIVAPPPGSKEIWNEVRDYLIHERCLDSSVVDDCHARGYLYGTSGWNEPERRVWVGAGAVFVTRNEKCQATGAFVRAVRKEIHVAKRLISGMDRSAGFFWRYIRGGEAPTPPVFVISEAPIEALSLETLALREGRPCANTLFAAISGAGGEQPFQRRMAQVLGRDGKVIISLNRDENGAGDEMMQRLAAPFRHEVENGRVKLHKPSSFNDWNDVLRNRGAG